jgi:hypothetical protein
MVDSLHESKVDDTTTGNGNSALCTVSYATGLSLNELTLAKESSTSSTNIGVLFIRILSEKDITSLNSSILFVSSTISQDTGAYSLFSNLSRLSFTLTEPNDSFEVDLVDHVEYDLESSLVVFGFLSIFLESYDDLGLILVIIKSYDGQGDSPWQTLLRGT